MKLLITGGAGFIGSNLIHHIIERPEIAQVGESGLPHLRRASGQSCSSRKHPKYVFRKSGPARQDRGVGSRAKATHHHVMHLAAESHVDRSITGPGDFIHTNVVGTFNLLEACRTVWSEQGSDRSAGEQVSITFRPTKSTAAWARPVISPKRHLTRRIPLTPPARRSSDMLVRAYHHTYGLPTVITNCSNNYGPFQFPEKLIPVVIQSVMARKPIPVYGDGMNVRDWLYVRDHAEALWQVLTRGEAAKLTTSAVTTNGRTSVSWS